VKRRKRKTKTVAIDGTLKTSDSCFRWKESHISWEQGKAHRMEVAVIETVSVDCVPVLSQDLILQQAI
jgi:hypothetical protein